MNDAAKPVSERAFLDRYFSLTENGTNVRTELIAGLTTFLASAAALLYVACVMMQGLAEIAWDDITEYAPAVVAAVTMPLTYSIATGIGLGFITYALAKIIAGKLSEAKPAVLALAALFAVKFAVT